MNRFDFLFQHSTTRFTQYSIWILLVFALLLAIQAPPHEYGVQQETPATFLFVMPEKVVRSLIVYEVVRLLLIAGIIGWAFQKMLPFSCWLTVFSAHCLWALRMENVSSGAHVFHLTNWLLTIHALWIYFYTVPIKRALKEGEFWKKPLVPRWVFLLSVFYIGWFHSCAGIAKLSYSGLDWANGISLQLWTHQFAWRESPTSQLLLNSRLMTQMLQVGTLIFETTAILAIFHRHLRLLCGLALAGFYVGVLTSFVDFGFHMNFLLVLWFFLPIEEWFFNRQSDLPAGESSDTTEPNSSAVSKSSSEAVSS